jgi:hypothetical protein
MRSLLLLAALLLPLLDHSAFAQNPPPPVPCASISPQAVTSVPAPFDTDMKLVCLIGDGQMLFPQDGTHWLDRYSANGMVLTAMDDRPGPNGNLHPATAWYVSLTPRKTSPADDAQLRAVLTQAVRPQLIDSATIAELVAVTSSGELKQEFIITPADPSAAGGIKLLVECYHFCQGGDEPYILAIFPDSKSR